MKLLTESQDKQGVPENDFLTQPKASPLLDPKANNVSFDTYKTHQGKAIPASPDVTVNQPLHGDKEPSAIVVPSAPVKAAPKRQRNRGPPKTPMKEKRHRQESPE